MVKKWVKNKAEAFYLLASALFFLKAINFTKNILCIIDILVFTAFKKIIHYLLKI